MERQEYFRRNGVSEADWENTPNGVKRLLDSILGQIEQRTTPNDVMQLVEAILERIEQRTTAIAQCKDSFMSCKRD
jgi:hypothetical protein